MCSDRPLLPVTKIATLPGVREHNEGEPVELWFNENGRVVIRAWNECHNNYTDVDLFDLLEWAKTEPEIADARGSHAALQRPK